MKLPSRAVPFKRTAHWGRWPKNHKLSFNSNTSLHAFAVRAPFCSRVNFSSHLGVMVLIRMRQTRTNRGQSRTQTLRCLTARLHMRFLMRFWCDFDAILVAIFDAISNRMCKLPAISWRFHGDLSPRNRRCFEPAQIQMRFCGDFEAKTVLPYPPRVFCRDGGKQ